MIYMSNCPMSIRLTASEPGTLQGLARKGKRRMVGRLCTLRTRPPSEAIPDLIRRCRPPEMSCYFHFRKDKAIYVTAKD